MANEETDIVSCVVEILTKARVWVWRQNSGTVRAKSGWYHGAPKGTPDVCGVLNDGRFFGIEVKTETGKLRPSQIAWRDRARKNGARFGVARSGVQALALVRLWQAGKNVEEVS